jgi:putative YphP/YqiW family bacilliredoxin
MVGWDLITPRRGKENSTCFTPNISWRPCTQGNQLGCQGTQDIEAVDQAVQTTPGTLIIVVNSVRLRAGKARPGIALALNHSVTPDVSATVFAGADTAATDRARGYFTGYPPSSPSVGILKGGKLVYMMERHQIESRSAEAIANDLVAAFDKHCAPAPVAG